MLILSYPVGIWGTERGLKILACATFADHFVSNYYFETSLSGPHLFERCILHEKAKTCAFIY